MKTDQEEDQPDQSGMPLDDVLFWSAMLAILMVAGFLALLMLAGRLGLMK